MPNFTLLSTGQQAVTSSAAALPALSAGAGGGISVILEALKANIASVFYGPLGVTTSTGKELAPGAQDVLMVENLDQIYVIGTAGSVSWVAYNDY